MALEEQIDLPQKVSGDQAVFEVREELIISAVGE
jgi:hypothetical protein